MELAIKALSKDLVDDFLCFFDEVAFTDNEDWDGCYCYYYHFDKDNDQWCRRSAKSNRSSAKKMIEEGKMKGYLAYLDGEPIGWCNANDKKNFSRLVSDEDLWDGSEEKIYSIVCYVIAPDHRRKGVASQILKEICIDCSKNGYQYIEAYPRKGDLTSAMHYHGPLSMYLKEGFFVYKEFNGCDIVRKKL